MGNVVDWIVVIAFVAWALMAHGQTSWMVLTTVMAFMIGFLIVDGMF
jgi:hypothetical protein